MKKNLLILAGLASAMLMSCTENLNDTTLDESSKMTSLSFTVSGEVDAEFETASAGSTTKVTYSDGLGIRWDAEKDKSLCLMYSNSDSFFSNEEGCSITNPSEIVVGDDLSATFTASIPADTRYLAYYLNGGNGSTPHFDWTTSLTQARAGEVEGLKLYSDVHSLTIEDGRFVVGETKAKLAGALIRIFIYSTTGSKEKVKSVNIKTNSDVFGAGWYNFIKNQYSWETHAKEATVTLTEAFDLTDVREASASAGIYIPVRTEKTGAVTNTGISYEVTMESGALYRFSSETATRTWASGTLYDELLNLDKASSKVKLEAFWHRYIYNDWGGQNIMSPHLNASVPAGSGNGNTDSINCTGVVPEDFEEKFLVESTASWLTIDSWEGNKIKYSYEANGTGAERTATIYVSLREEYRENYEIVKRWDASWMDEHPLRLLVFDVIQQ